MVLVLAVLVVVGALLVYRGVLGHRVGDTVFCAECSYELSGFDAGAEAFERRREDRASAEVCPECGARLVEASQVSIGRLVRRPRSLAAGAVLLLLLVTVVSGSQLPVVANFRWIEYKPEKWLLRDAVKRHEDQVRQANAEGTPSRGNKDLAELYRRAQDGALSDAVLVDVTRAGIEFMKAWAAGETNYPFSASSSYGGSTLWAQAGGIALDQKLLTREERVAFCTATVRVRVLTPERVVRGDPLPIKFIVDAWGPDWDSLADNAWPSAWGAGAMDFTLRSATVDGQAIDLVQFDDDGGLKRLKSRRQRIDTRPWTIPADEHPRADYPIGRHKLKVELTARVRYEERLHAWAEGPYASLGALGFPDEGWPIVVETEFEVVERGPTRTIVPLRGAFGLEAKLEAMGGRYWNLTLQVPRNRPRPESPAWVRHRDIFAARLSVRAGDQTFDLGPWVSLDNYGFVFLPEISQEQVGAILNAPTGSAVFVVTPDADIARLVTAPGALIATDPIELPIEIKRRGDEGP